MIEKEMADRGSNSDFNLKSVKEQRVNGNWRINLMYLNVLC